MGLASFRIVASAGQPLAVHLNGQQLPDGMNVLGYDLRMVDGIPQLALFVNGETSIEGEGLVFLKPEGGDEIGYLRAFLEGLDPDELERKAIEHAPTLESKLGAGFVDALLEMVSVEEKKR